MKNKIKAFLTHTYLFAVTFGLLAPQRAWADEGGGIGGTKLVTGFQQLLNDATTALMAFAVPVTVLCVVFFLIMRSASDEQNQKKWGDRAKTAVVCGIGAIVAGGLIKVVAGYFQ